PSPDPAVPSSRPIVPPCGDASTAVAAPLQERALLAICLTPSQLTAWCGVSPGRPALVRRAQRLLCPAAPATRPVADAPGPSYGTTGGLGEQRADGPGDSRPAASPRVHAQRASRDGEAGADRGSAAAVAPARQSGSEGAQRGDRRARARARSPRHAGDSAADQADVTGALRLNSIGRGAVPPHGRTGDYAFRH